MHTVCKRVVPFGYWLSAIHGLPLACRAELGPGRGLANCIDSVFVDFMLLRQCFSLVVAVSLWVLAYRD